MMALALFLLVALAILTGFPVAFALGGASLVVAAIGILLGHFDPAFLQALPNRLYGVMTNATLLAVPLFVFMGVMLERARIAEQLLETMAILFGSLRGGLGISVVLVGMLLAASTGIVGATVVTMGLLSLPTMLKRGYDAKVATGVICASGTLGQIIPPSIVLVLLGDVLSSAYQQAQLDMGIFSPETVSVGDLFIGALIPGLILVLLYLVWVSLLAWRVPDSMPSVSQAEVISDKSLRSNIFKVLVPPILLIVAVLGSIIGGVATPTEAASVGAAGAVFLAYFYKQFSIENLYEVARSTTQVTCMVFTILIGAAIFSLVFRGFGGDELVTDFLTNLPGGKVSALAMTMLVLFLLGFILDFIEIIFIVVPIVGPILLAMGIDPVWLGVMIAVNLQTSFLTPPFGFALFYLRGVAPTEVKTREIYLGSLPFIGLQLIVLSALAIWPALVTYLPDLFNKV